MLNKKNKKLYLLFLITSYISTGDLPNKDGDVILDGIIPENIIAKELENEENADLENNENNKDDSEKIDNKSLEKIMNMCLDIFDDLMQKALENNFSQEDIIKLFEKELNFYNLIQPIILKYLSIVKNNSKHNRSKFITLNEIKIFLNFLKNFISLVDIKNDLSNTILNIDINKINNTIELLEIINNLNKQIKKNNKKSISNEVFKKTIESINSTIDSTAVLIKNIINNISKGKYLKKSLYDSIFYPTKKVKSKINDNASNFQNELLLAYFQILNNKLQKAQLLLHDIGNIGHSIPSDKLNNLCQEIINDIVSAIGGCQYFIEESKFYPKNKNFDLNNNDMVTFEIELIKNKTKEYTEKLLKKANILTLKSANFNPKKFAEDIEKIQKIISKSVANEQELTLFFFQNWYRKIVLHVEKTGNKNDFTKFIKKAFAPKNWITLFATYIGLDFMLWLSHFKKYSTTQSLLKIGLEAYQFVTRSGEVNSYSNESDKYTSPYLKLVSFRTKLNLPNQSPESFLARELTDGNSIASEYGASMTSVMVNEGKNMTTLINNQKVKDVLDNKTTLKFVNFSPEVNEQAMWANSTLEQYHEFNKKFELIDNDSKGKIFELIDYEVLSALTDNNKIERLKTRCQENNIANLSNIDKIIEIAAEKYNLDIKTQKQLKIYNDEWIMNRQRNGIGDSLSGIPFGPALGGSGIGFGIKKLGDYLESNGFFYYLGLFQKKFHYFMMGELYQDNNNIHEAIDNESDTYPYTLYDKTFDSLDKQGVLVWFKDVLNFIEASCNNKLYNGSDKITKCIGLFGPSGSGKSFIVRTFAQSIDAIAKKYKSDVSVNFYSIDPKHFNGIIQNGQTTKVDIIAELNQVLEEIRLKGGFYIIHLDEFHLFFTQDGKISQEKLADLLKFFNDLFVKQKTYKRVGGMYVICSTNKPQFIPHEFFDNGDRIGEIATIAYPTGQEIVDILKSELLKNNVYIEHINFDYLVPLVEGCDLTYGVIIKIANKAFNIAKIKNRIIDDDILYYAINDVVRKIILNHSDNAAKEITSDMENNAALYYGALTATAINFNHKNNRIYDFDMATILPVKMSVTPQHIDRLYIKPNIETIRLGEAFYGKAPYFDAYDAKTTAVEIIKAIGPTAYLDFEKIPKINRQESLAEIYRLLYSYFSSQIKFADTAQRLEVNNQKKNLGKELKVGDFNDTYNDIALHQVIMNILIKAEKALIDYYNEEEVKQFILLVAELLKENKIVTKKDIMNNATCSELLIKIEPKFNNLLENIAQELY